MNDIQVRYAIRSTDATGAVKYYPGKKFYYGFSEDGLAGAQMYVTKRAAVAEINASKKMSRTGSADWIAQAEAWTRAEIVTVEISFKIGLDK